jgi:hypothetical protein
MRVRAAFLVLLCAAACGTDLVLREVDARALSPEGIPVNKRAAFRSQVVIAKGVELTLDPALPPGRSSGVDPVKLLSVNVSRQAFADGKVSIDLDEMQRLKQVTISSTSGAANGLTTASKVIEAIEPDASKK